LADALAELRRAEELDPAQPDVHYTLGVTLWQQGEFDPAAEELRAAIREDIRLQPYFAGAHTTLSAILRQLGDAEGAATEARAGLEISKRKTDQQAATFATNSGKRLLNAGDLDGAISQFRSAINSMPDYAPAHFQLALAFQRKGETAEAAKEFRKAAELDNRFQPPPR